MIAHAYRLPSTSAADDLFVPGLTDEIDAAACEEAQAALAPLVEKARRTGVAARGLVRGGEPDVVVVSEARRAGAELFVIGTHGRRGLKRALLGSVAASVLADANCPVLTVRSDVAAPTSANVRGNDSSSSDSRHRTLLEERS